MNFEKEKSALDLVFAGLDRACRAGVFGLLEAKDQVDNLTVLSTHFNQGVHGIISQLVQVPADEPSEEGTEQVPGTNDRIAKPKSR